MLRHRRRETWGHEEQRAWWERPGIGGKPRITFAFYESWYPTLESGAEPSCKLEVSTNLGWALLPPLPPNPKESLATSQGSGLGGKGKKFFLGGRGEGHKG